MSLDRSESRVLHGCLDVGLTTVSQMVGKVADDE
jgi:hypothetical protein